MSDSNPYTTPPQPGPPGSQGQPPSPYGDQPAPYGAQPYGSPYGAPQPSQGGRDPGKRPGTVTAAGIITIVMSALALLAGALLAIVGAVGSDSFYDSFRDGSGGAYDDFNNEELGTLILVIGIVLVVWSAVAILLGVLVMRRSSVARVLLVISASFAAVVSLVGILSIVSALSLIAAIVVIVMLFTGGANDWFARRAPAPSWG